jgi:guanylate kinase
LVVINVIVSVYIPIRIIEVRVSIRVTFDLKLTFIYAFAHFFTMKATSLLALLTMLFSHAACFTATRLASIHASRAPCLSLSSSTAQSLLDPLIVCGPSGVGKGTIISKYMSECGGSNYFGFCVSHTTRQPREGEQEGIHYYFTRVDDMRKMIDNGLFLETAQVHGNYYGTSWKALERQDGKRALLDIDVQGVKRIKSLQEAGRLEPKFIFVAPPSYETLKERLVNRNSETPESLQRRLANAQAELDYGLAGNFDAVIVNNDLDEAVKDFERVVKDLYGI